ncbi:MAG TPA: hypothetical protein VHY08_02885 [Bacillota bacterium]|nr:hypothetical protein [Bacillota bacterium]
MGQKNNHLDQVRNLLATLKSEIAVAREKHEKTLLEYGADHPQTIASRKELDLLMSELKNFLYWLDQIKI